MTLHRTALIAALAFVVCPAALAQSYRCTGHNGGYYYSDRPCQNVGPASTKLGGYGPAPEPVARPRPVQLPSRAPEYVKYMSSECASLHDGLRTASSRGLTHQTISDLRWDYDRKCRNDETQARNRESQEQQNDQRQRRDAQAQSAEAVQREQAQVQRTGAQCGEMRRIIASKHERIATLSPGEIADLKRFEANFAERCGTPR